MHKLLTWLHKVYDRLFSRRADSDSRPGLETVFAGSETDRTTPSGRNGAGRDRINQRLVGLLAVAALVLAVLLWQLWQLQVVRGEAFAVRSQYNTLSSQPLFAPRGAITDARGNQLAYSREATSTLYFQRRYATSSGMGHLLGYVSYPQRDQSGNFFRLQTEGQAGVEAGFDERLSAKPGRKIFETNAVGQVVSESIVTDPEPGQEVQLTIDTKLQSKLFSLLERTANERDFVGGAGVIMDVRSGELKAMASYPGFDPNKIMDKDSYLKQLQTATSSPFLNRVTEGRFTPGSIVKPFVAAGALDAGVVSPQTTIVSEGQLRVPNPYDPDEFSVFEDWKAHGPVQLREALAVSSNVYFYQIGGGFKDQSGLGIDRIVKYSRGFGLEEKTGIKGFSEATGVIPTPDWKRRNFADGQWRLGDTYNTAIGQYGYQVTPLQMIRAVSGLATGGDLVTPTVRPRTDPETEAVTPKIEPFTYQVVREGMRRAVTSRKGTAHNLDVSFADIAAKTGTAQLGGDMGGVNSWIIGFWPADKPRYAFTVVMSDGPEDNVVGGLFVMRRLLEWMETNRPEYLPKIQNTDT